MRKWIIALFFAAVAATAQERTTLTGAVSDNEGKRVEGATVLVYAAGVKTGYSTYCPTCYSDCGKRATTNADGGFRIMGLSPELWFKLLVVRDGFQPAFVDRVDPSRGPASAVVLPARPVPEDLRRVLRGRVIDNLGLAVRDALVEPRGILTFAGAAMYGTIPGLDPVAVTNSKGEFALTHAEPISQMLVLVTARGMAPKLFTQLTTGRDPHTLTVTLGAVIRGRLVDRGKPVGGAEVGLFARRHGYGGGLKLIGDPYSEIRIGTKDDGTFAITGVPAPVEWYIYGKMDSIKSRGATGVIECVTRQDGEEVDVGDIGIKPAHRVRGKVVLSDGKPIPGGMRILASSDLAFDAQVVPLPADGRFEFIGLSTGTFSISPAVRRYRRQDGSDRDILVDRDIDDLVIVLDPVP